MRYLETQELTAVSMSLTIFYIVRRQHKAVSPCGEQEPHTMICTIFAAGVFNSVCHIIALKQCAYTEVDRGTPPLA